MAWDSGRVEEDKQIFIKYEGSELRPETRYTWKISVWNNLGERTESEEAFFG